MHRVLTALVTPFTELGDVDLDNMAKMVVEQLDRNCGVVLFGTTGECPTLKQEERDIIMKEISDLRRNANDIVIGVGGNNTSECIHNVENAIKYGYSTFMITTPYYNKPTPLGLQKHFEAICRSSPDSKFILYNVPTRTNVNLLPSTLLNITESCNNVIGIKEASGDLGQMMLIRKLCPHLIMYCGDDGLIIPAMSIGAYGVISVLSNYAPEFVSRIVKYCTDGNYTEALRIHNRVDDLIRLLFTETNPAPIKYMLKKSGRIESDFVRLPLVPMQNGENKRKIDDYVTGLSD